MLRWYDASGCVFIAYASDFRIRLGGILRVDLWKHEKQRRIPGYHVAELAPWKE